MPADTLEDLTRREGTHLLVRAGEYSCALPLALVRRVVRALTVHPLPGAAGELEGLAEFGGEPLPVLNLARLGNASPGANPSYPVTGVVRGGAAGGGALAADEILGVVADLRVLPAAPALRRFWPEEPAGVAVHAGMPVVVVD